MGVLEGKTARGHVCRPHAYCGALGTAPRRTGAKATMLRIETFAPVHRCTAPSTSSLRRWITRQDLVAGSVQEDGGGVGSAWGMGEGAMGHDVLVGVAEEGADDARLEDLALLLRR